MGEVKHTPRPWVADIVEGCWIVFDADGEYVAQIAWGDHSPNERANARLIAACPMMFDYIAKRAAEGDVEAAVIVEAASATR